MGAFGKSNHRVIAGIYEALPGNSYFWRRAGLVRAVLQRVSSNLDVAGDLVN